MVRKLLVFVSLALLLAACAAPAATGPHIRVESAWARPAMLAMADTTATPDMSSMPGMATTETPGSLASMPGMAGSGPSSAVYFVIINDGDQADTLVGASTEVASQTGLHETKVENNIAQMMPIASLEIPAHGQVEFKPGGYHVMLEGLKQNLQEGATIQLSLQFKTSGTITLDVPVKQGN